MGTVYNFVSEFKQNPTERIVTCKIRHETPFRSSNGCIASCVLPLKDLSPTSICFIVTTGNSKFYSLYATQESKNEASEAVTNIGIWVSVLAKPNRILFSEKYITVEGTPGLRTLICKDLIEIPQTECTLEIAVKFIEVNNSEVNFPIFEQRSSNKIHTKQSGTLIHTKASDGGSLPVLSKCEPSLNDSRKMPEPHHSNIPAYNLRRSLPNSEEFEVKHTCGRQNGVNKDIHS